MCRLLTERPPKLAMGEVASPLCFDLAKRLKKPPRALAQEIANSLKPIPGVARVEVAGGGYLNLFFDRAEFFRGACEEAGSGTMPAPQADAPKTLVEHTSVNPNKAAHIGHLRNAVLGDTFCGCCGTRASAWRCRTTSTTPACRWRMWCSDFCISRENRSGDVRALADAAEIRLPLLGFYTRVTHFLAEDKARLELRAQTLKEIEEGHGDGGEDGGAGGDGDRSPPPATLDRLGIDYDLLSQESEILHLKFWDAAFAMLKERGAIQMRRRAKMRGAG